MLLTIFNLIFAIILGGGPTGELPTKSSKAADAKMLKTAKKQLLVGEVEDARQILETLIQRDPKNADYNYEMGRNLYFTHPDKELALPYLEAAVQYCGKDTMGDVFYMLGDLYQQEGSFEQAIEAFTNMKRFTRNNAAGKRLNTELNTRISKCTKAKARAIARQEKN